ncbi:MAG: hypothetical protein N2645_03995 [Clostridia bacterium]|nr:hypothetical protein [Clostridia bacterium]
MSCKYTVKALKDCSNKGMLKVKSLSTDEYITSCYWCRIAASSFLIRTSKEKVISARKFLTIHSEFEVI